MRFETMTRTVFHFAREMARAEHPLIEGAYVPDPVESLGVRNYWRTLDPFTRSQWVRRSKGLVMMIIGSYDSPWKQIERYGWGDCECPAEVELPLDAPKSSRPIDKLICERCGGEGKEVV